LIHVCLFGASQSAEAILRCAFQYRSSKPARQGLSASELVVVLGWAVGALIIRMRLSLTPATMVQLAAEIMMATSRVGPFDEPVADVTRPTLGGPTY
jgi:hypothetical protein